MSNNIEDLIPEGPHDQEPDGEVREAQSEGLAQQLAQADENQEIYQGVTEERLREAINDIIGESHEPHDEQLDEVVEEQPRAVRVDVNSLPDGITLADHTRYYDQTGNLIVGSSTETQVTVDTNSTTDAVTGSPTYITDNNSGLIYTGSVTVTVDGTGDARPVEEVEIPPMSPEETQRMIETVRQNKIAAQEESIKHKRATYLEDISITKDDLVIVVNEDNDDIFNLYHIDVEGEYLVRDATSNYRLTNRNRGSSNSKFCRNSLVFDKNMNYLVINADGRRSRGLLSDQKIRTRRDRRRIWNNQLNHGSADHYGTEESFVIVDKDTFINSRGRKWKVKRRENMSYLKIKEAKAYYSIRFEQTEMFLKWMKDILNQICSPEDYEILYIFDKFGTSLTNIFRLIFRFRDITITNSIEMTHHIGDMLTMTMGKHDLSSLFEVSCMLEGGIHGARITFTPEDARASYRHSHLTSGMKNFSGFCTGGEDYSAGRESRATEYDIHYHYFKISSFLKWESLEGGPHFKMETINAHGNVINLSKTTMSGIDSSIIYIRELMNRVNQHPDKFDYFSDCFSIINTQGVLKFIVNYEMFYEKFIELFDNETIKNIHRRMGLYLNTYNTLDKTFHEILNESAILPERILKDAKANLQLLVPVYMNGKYIRPHLTNYNANAALDGMRFCPEPDSMRAIAQYILYKLTDKLEKHGNTSANESSREESGVSAL